MQENKIKQGSKLTFTFMSQLSLTLRDEKEKTEAKVMGVLSRFCRQKKNQAGTFNSIHKKKQ